MSLKPRRKGGQKRRLTIERLEDRSVLSAAGYDVGLSAPAHSDAVDPVVDVAPFETSPTLAGRHEVDLTLLTESTRTAFVAPAASLARRPVDARIAALIAARDEDGLRLLLDKHGERVKKYLQLCFCPADLDLDAAINEGAYRVWTSFDATKGASVGTFFHLVSKRAAIDSMKSGNQHKQTVSLANTSEPKVHESGIAPEERREVQEIIDVGLSSLTSLERATIEADYLSNGKAANKDVANQFGVTSGAVTHARSSAYAKLKPLFDAYDSK